MRSTPARTGTILSTIRRGCCSDRTYALPKLTVYICSVRADGRRRLSDQNPEAKAACGRCRNRNSRDIRHRPVQRPRMCDLHDGSQGHCMPPVPPHVHVLGLCKDSQHACRYLPDLSYSGRITASNSGSSWICTTSGWCAQRPSHWAVWSGASPRAAVATAAAAATTVVAAHCRHEVFQWRRRQVSRDHLSKVSHVCLMLALSLGIIYTGTGCNAKQPDEIHPCPLSTLSFLSVAVPCF
jgi:hypothetical protein